jgi:hypothetical protein
VTTRSLHPPYPSERGSVAIEFALSVIILAILIFGCIGVAMGFYTYEVVNEYARDASRYAIVHGDGCSHTVNGTPTPCSIGAGGDQSAPASVALANYLNHQIFPGINGNNLRVQTTYGPPPGVISCLGTSCNSAGNQVTVSVTYQYLYNIPFIPARLINMQGTSTMVISQ